MNYKDFKLKQQGETSKFLEDNVHYAYGPEQFNNLMKKLGTTEEEFVRDYKPFIGGGAIKRDKEKEWNQLAGRHFTELHNAMDADDNFAIEAFKTEFENFEYAVGHDLTPVILSLGYSEHDIIGNDRLLKIFHEAKKQYKAEWAAANS